MFASCDFLKTLIAYTWRSYLSNKPSENSVDGKMSYGLDGFNFLKNLFNQYF